MIAYHVMQFGKNIQYFSTDILDVIETIGTVAVETPVLISKRVMTFDEFKNEVIKIDNSNQETQQL